MDVERAFLFILNKQHPTSHGIHKVCKTASTGCTVHAIRLATFIFYPFYVYARLYINSWWWFCWILLWNVLHPASRVRRDAVTAMIWTKFYCHCCVLSCGRRNDDFKLELELLFYSRDFFCVAQRLLHPFQSNFNPIRSKVNTIAKPV